MAAIVPGQGSSFGNGSIIEGVSFFVQDTPPTALATGDRWTKTNDNGLPASSGNYIWTGSLWVTEDLFFQEAGVTRNLAQINADLVEGGSFGLFTGTARCGIAFGFNPVVYLDNVTFLTYNASFTTPNFSGLNSFELWPALADSADSDVLAVTVNNTGIIEIPGGAISASFNLLTAINLTTIATGLRLNCFVRNVVGTPLFAGVGSIFIGMAIGIRGVHP